MDETKKQEVQQLNVQIGRRLREVRESNNYTQEEFAETLGVSIVHYRKLEGGKYRLQNENIVRLYHTYRIDPTFLLTGEKQEAFDIEKSFVNCTMEQREELIGRMFTYVRNLMKK